MLIVRASIIMCYEANAFPLLLLLTETIGKLAPVFLLLYKTYVGKKIRYPIKISILKNL